MTCTLLPKKSSQACAIFKIALRRTRMKNLRVPPLDASFPSVLSASSAVNKARPSGAPVYFVFMSAVTLLGILFAPQLIGVMTWWSWSPEKTALTILLTRIMWPFILLVSVAALVMGMLNARNVFGMPAMASSFFNLGSIISGVALGWWFGPYFSGRSLI